MLLLTFNAGPNRFAVDVARIVELVPRVQLRKVPHAPAFIAGLLGYRGKIVPVIDLGLLLDVVPCRDFLSTRIILVDDSADPRSHLKPSRDDSCGATGTEEAGPQRDSHLLGLIAERVSDLTYAQPEEMIAVPSWLPQASYLGSILQTDQGIVQLIVVENIRNASFPSTLLGQDTALGTRTEP